MKKILSIILVMVSGIILSQNIGDFKSIGTGTWNQNVTSSSNAIWSVWNGTSYVNITNSTTGVTIGSTTYYYPGSTNPTAASAASNVIISTGNTITSPNANTTYSFSELTINGTLNLNPNLTLSTTKKVTVNGNLVWQTASVNNTLTLSQPNAVFVTTGTTPLTGGGSTCNGKQYLVINGVTYMQCTNGATTYPTFANIQSAGGTLQALPTANPQLISPGQSTSLSGSASGYQSGTTTYSWSGTGPAGLKYGPTTASTSAAFSPGNLSISGFYDFTLTATSGGFSNSQTVRVTVSCPTGFDPTIVDNFVGTFHSGALKGQDGKWYGWGENMPPDQTYKEINHVNGYLPTGVSAVKVSGGSSGIGANQLAIIGSDGKIYGAGVNGPVLAVAYNNNNSVTGLTLPTNSATNQPYTAYDVKSFYAGYQTMALVMNDGKGFTWSQQNNIAKGDGTLGTGWSSAVKSNAATNPVVTNFVQIRGDTNASYNTGFIGLTADGQIYVWGVGSFIPSATATTTINPIASPNNRYATLVTNMPTAAGKAVLVQMNYGSGGISYYFMTDTKKLWSVGKNDHYQLGYTAINDTTDAYAWVQVRKPIYNSSMVVTGWTNADVVYFSTDEHDNNTSSTQGNDGSVMYITTNGSVYGFGTSGDGLLAYGSSADTPPAIALTEDPANPGVFIPMNGSTALQTATFVEVGGHISFVVKANGSACIAGHGLNGSLLGNLDTSVNDVEFDQYKAGSCTTIPNAPCPIVPAVPAPTANNDTFSVAQGGTTPSVLGNDLSSGSVTATTSNVNFTWLSAAPAGFTLNANGTITIDSNTLPGTYQVTYQICDPVNTNSCATAVATITVTSNCPPTAGASYAVNTASTNTNTYSDAAATSTTTPFKTDYTVKDAANNTIATANITMNSIVGYSGVAYNSDSPVSSASTGYYTSHTKSIRIQGVTDQAVGNDVMNYTINPTSSLLGYTTQVTVSDYIRQTSTSGNTEASTFTISWTGGPVGAVATYNDPAIATVQTNTDTTFYTNGAPTGFDWQNGEIVGTSKTGVVTNGGSFMVYDTQNSITQWSVTLPAGATNIKVQKVTLKGGLAAGPTSNAADGIDALYPMYGYKVTSGVNRIGESFNEWLSFTVNLVKTTCPCYNVPADLTTSVPTNHGITLLKRAGNDGDGNTANDWPMMRNSAHTVLESNGRGFVITRMTTKEIEGDNTATPVVPSKITAPVVGMMIYDTTVPCLKIYTGSGAGEGWKCFSTPACPD